MITQNADDKAGDKNVKEKTFNSPSLLVQDNLNILSKLKIFTCWKGLHLTKLTFSLGLTNRNPFLRLVIISFTVAKYKKLSLSNCS